MFNELKAEFGRVNKALVDMPSAPGGGTAICMA